MAVPLQHRLLQLGTPAAQRITSVQDLDHDIRCIDHLEEESGQPNDDQVGRALPGNTDGSATLFSSEHR